MLGGLRWRTLLALVAILFATGPGCIPREMTGLWQGTLYLNDGPTPVVLAVHLRESGDMYGYVLGGDDSLRVTGGRQDAAGRVTVRLEHARADGVRDIELRGRMVGTRFRGTASDGRAFSFERFGNDTVTERRMLIGLLGDDGQPVELIDLGVLTEPGGRLLAGTYSTRVGCGHVGCGGTTTAYVGTTGAESDPTIRATLAHGGTCAGSTVVELRYDPASTLHTGEFQTRDCAGSRVGSAIGSGATRTRATHVLAVLRAYASLADRLERGSTLPGAVAPIAPDYLHQSRSAAHLVQEINEQILRYRNIRTAFTRFRNVHTIEDPFIFRDLPTGFGADFSDVRTGLEGSVTVEFLRADTRRGQDALRFLRGEGSEFLIVGNQISHDLPYVNYAVGSEHVLIGTVGGSIYASVGTWGAHSPGHTGNFNGNAKADWVGLYAASHAQLTELSGDGNGVCEPGETCGLPERELLARAVEYTAPGNRFRIDSVKYERVSQPDFYYGGDQMWRVRGWLGSYSYDFVHLRGIAPDLRNAMLAAGYTDPWTVEVPSDNLITGAPVILDRGEGIAFPQIVATEVPGFPGFFSSGGIEVPSPWQQIEYSTFSGASGFEESVYRWLAPELESALAGVFERDARNPLSFRYGWALALSSRFLTLAEMALSNQDFNDRRSYTSLFDGLGGWWENDGRCLSPLLCDTLFSIFPIRKDTTFYDPSLYASPEVSVLIMQGTRDPYGLTRTGEVVDPYWPDPVSGSMVIGWHNGDGLPGEYQGVSYRLDTPRRMLRVAWGPIRADAATARAALPPVPALPPAGAPPFVGCNGTTLTCHTHDRP
jgi:hypothetical protein